MQTEFTHHLQNRPQYNMSSGNGRKAPTLIIINRKGDIQKIRLDSFNKDSLILGYEERNADIHIDDEVVSKAHGYLVNKNNRYYYKDLKSTNGTYVDFGRKRKFLYKSEEFEELFDGSILRIGSTKTRENLVLIWFTYMDNDEILERYTIDDTTKKSIHIGRSAECDIRLQHPSVSRTHAIIESAENEWILKDNKSLNGILVDGKTVQQSHVLQDKDAIQISGHQMIFSNRYIYYKSEISGISIQAHHVNKWVGKSTARKQILKDVAIDIKGNEFVAIIGGSGAGKTTLMNVINGFDKDFQGKVYCNNISLKENFQHIKSIIGYVPQEDIIYENLTLRHMLYYTAQLKMPEDTEKREIEERIDEVLDAIGLREHQNTYIRKMSGGQKKRASIAVELLADPKLFFLDEPTSGLDPGTEKNLMITLKDLAKKQGRTIVLVTHTTQNLDLCDKIIFMARGGQVGFIGSVAEAKVFFDTEDLTAIYGMLNEKPEFWAQKFQEEKGMQSDVEEPSSAPSFGSRHQSPLRQFAILTKRYVELMRNDLRRLLTLIVMPVGIGLLLVLVSDDDAFKIYESTKSMMFALSCAAIWIGVFNSIQEICKERSILKREYMAGLKLSVYMASKVIVQAIIAFVQTILLTGTFLLFVKTQEPGIIFDKAAVEIMITIWLTVLASESMGFIVSSVVRTGDRAMVFAPFILIVQLLFSGILFELGGIGEKISYITVSRWSVEALGSTADLNALDLRLQEEFPMLEHEAESLFDAELSHLMQDWSLLALITVIGIVISILWLKNVAKDGR